MKPENVLGNSYRHWNPARIRDGYSTIPLDPCIPANPNFFSRQVEGTPAPVSCYEGIYHQFSSNGTGRIIPFASVSASSSFELAGNTPPEIMGTRAHASSRDHKEAERRRRERINSHYSTLRTLLPCASKTDKASLLAEAIKQVKDLKRQTTEIAGRDFFPTETDEVTVFSGETSSDGRSVMKASFCCDDRSDILPELIKTLKSLRLRTLKAEISTLGGRMRNVLFVTGEEDCNNDSGNPSAGFLHDALKAVMERSGSGEISAGGLKRQRIMYRRTN